MKATTRLEPVLPPGMVLPTRLPRGFALGDYVVDAWIRDGSMAAIYRAHRITDGECAAVKLQLASMVRDPVVGERFEREAELLWRVHGCPHVVELLDLGMLDDGRRYLVTKWVEGQDFEELLDVLRNQDHPMAVARACRIARDVALGLAALHEHGVAHLALEPAHVVARRVEDGVDDVTLVDLGHAADLRGALAYDAQDEAQLCIPAYLAPERARGGEPSAACDIYALGVLLFETLSGTCLPPDGWSSETLPRVDALRHGAPPALGELVRACMSREVERRPASARMVAQVLDAITGALEAGASPGHEGASAVPPMALRTGDTLLGMPVPLVGARRAPSADPDDTEVAMRLEPVLAEPSVDPGDTEVVMRLEPAVWHEPPVDPDDTATTMVLEPAEHERLMYPDDTAATMVLEPVPALGPDASPGEASTSNLERLAPQQPWWLRWAVAATVLLALGGTGAWLVQRGEADEVKATSAVMASSMAAGAVEARAPKASSPAVSSRRDEGPTSARASLETSNPTKPPREAVDGAEVLVAVQPAPPAPQAPANDSPELDERARAAAASEATCADVRSRAETGKQEQEWGSVLEATRKRGCWRSAELRVARARLRVTAFAELGQLERCAAEGGRSRDREVVARATQCRHELAPTGADAIADADAAPTGAPSGPSAAVGAEVDQSGANGDVDTKVAPVDADVAVDAGVTPVQADVAVDG